MSVTYLLLACISIHPELCERANAAAASDPQYQPIVEMVEQATSEAARRQRIVERLIASQGRRP
jgi:hypothetical protein